MSAPLMVVAGERDAAARRRARLARQWTGFITIDMDGSSGTRGAHRVL